MSPLILTGVNNRPRSVVPQHTHTHAHSALRPWSWFVTVGPGLFVAVELAAWLLRVTFLPWRGAVGFIGRGSTSTPLSPGRRWSSLAGLLLWMSGPIPRPSGYSKTGHVGYGTLTGGTGGDRLPAFLTSCFRTCAGSPCERPLQGRCSGGADHSFALEERARSPPRASRRDTVWRGAHTHTHTHTHARTYTHPLVAEHLDLWKAPENGVCPREGANARSVELLCRTASAYYVQSRSSGKRLEIVF